MITYEELRMRLSPQQRRAAELLVTNDFLPKGEKKNLDQLSEEIGIDRRTLYNWRQNADFTRYMAAHSDGELSNYRSLADSQLIKLIQGAYTNNGTPSIKALEMYYKLEGRLVERSVTMTDDKANQPRMSREELSDQIIELNKFIQ